MKINSIDIKNIGGIKSLYLDFDNSFNVICGPNGIGKTTILECIAHTFTVHNTSILRRHVASTAGSFLSTVEVDGGTQQISNTIHDFEPTSNTSFIQGLNNQSQYLLSLKVNRTFEYQQLDAIRRDNLKDTNTSAQEAKHGINSHEIKGWFVNRYLYSAHQGALSAQQLNNFELAKACFSILNRDFCFSHVDAGSNEIMIQTPNGVIYYEYLSSGFKSCLSIIFGIIKEIEYRFKNPTINAIDFDGIIIIDELELHLHPEWQGKIAEILLRVFPNAQFIASTHSPHIIQSAAPNQIIALGLNEGSVQRRKMSSGTYGYQGWTVEEVLTEVMGMSDTRTETFHAAIRDFEVAIQDEDAHRGRLAYAILDELLHPSNHLRKLLKLELATIQEREND